jgi:hypothetical protein
MMQAVQAKRQTKEAIDQGGDQQRLAGVAQGENNRTPDVAVTEHIGCNCRANHARHDGQPGRPAHANKHSGGNTCGRPKNRNAIGLRQEFKAQSRREEISYSYPDREA